MRSSRRQFLEQVGWGMLALAGTAMSTRARGARIAAAEPDGMMADALVSISPHLAAY